MVVRRWPVGLLVLVAFSGAAPQGKNRQKQASSTRGSTTTTTSTTPAPEPVYWWLEGEVSPFGGRNYNIQEAGDRQTVARIESRSEESSGYYSGGTFSTCWLHSLRSSSVVRPCHTVTQENCLSPPPTGLPPQNQFSNCMRIFCSFDIVAFYGSNCM